MSPADETQVNVEPGVSRRIKGGVARLGDGKLPVNLYCASHSPIASSFSVFNNLFPV